MIQSAIPFETPLLGFAAWSGTGKTTLLRNLIPLLKNASVRVAAIKHTHHNFDIDQPGKDSYELRKSGAGQVLVASAKRWALVNENENPTDEPNLAELLPQLDHKNLDLVLVEGFKHEPIPRIELYRPEIAQKKQRKEGKELLFTDDSHIIAVATPFPTQIPTQTTLPILNLDDPQQIFAFIMSKIIASG